MATDTLNEATLLVHLRRSQFGERSAVEQGTVVVSYRSLINLCDELRTHLTTAGVQAGDRVIVLGGNGLSQIVALLVLPDMAAVAVPLEPPVGALRFRTIVKSSRAALCLVTGDEPAPIGVPCLHVDLDAQGKHLEVRAAAPDNQLCAGRPDVPDAGTMAMVRYTSGTTGAPKGTVLSHAAVLAGARLIASVFELTPEHRELLITPLALSGGWQRLAATLYAGGRVTLYQGLLSLPGFLEAFEQCQASGFFSPPPMIYMLLKGDADRTRRAMATCRMVEVGSAPIAADALSQLMQRLPDARIVVHYGLTECPRSTLLHARQQPDRLHSVGRAAPGCQIRVCAADGSVLAPETVGAIEVTGPQQASGYLGFTFPAGGRAGAAWICTGDVGRLDEAGYLTVLGREDDRINTGGHSFYPAEVEQELGAVEGVLEYRLAGVQDPRAILHQVPWLFAVPRDSADWCPAELLQRARRQLPAHMVPRRVVTVPEIPVNAAGKPDRRLLVACYGEQ